MDATAFTRVLSSLIARVPGAYAAALFDGEGECVDYAGVGDPFDIRIAAAELRVLIAQIATRDALGALEWLVLRGERRSVIVRTLPDDYALVTLLRRRAGFTASRRAFDDCERGLALEAGWDLPPRDREWFAIDVVADRRGRPRQIRRGGEGVRVEILGALASEIGARERGYRVRTERGNELLLVREPGRFWYADEPVERALAFGAGEDGPPTDPPKGL